MDKTKINLLRLHAINELRTAVRNHRSGDDEIKVLEKIGKCLRVGANISMMLIILNPLLPRED